MSESEPKATINVKIQDTGWFKGFMKCIHDAFDNSYSLDEAKEKVEKYLSDTERQ